MRAGFVKDLLLDNPLLIKHARSRLRRGTILGACSIVGALGLLIVWFSVLTSNFKTGVAFALTSALQLAILSVIGASQVAASVSKARESAILDFHRISPLPPLDVALGFFFGAPVLEYLLFAITLPLSIFCALLGDLGPGLVLKVLAAQLLLAWAFHGLALFSALLAKKPKANAGALVFVFFIVFGNLFGGLFGGVLWLRDDPTITFYGFPLPWLGFLALYLLPALGFLLIGSTRKMRSERMHALSKPQAIAFVATTTVLTLGGFWTVAGFDGLVLVVLYGLCVAAMVASITMTPTGSEYAKGLRRAERSGLDRLPAWDDLALNRLGVFAVSLIVLVGATIAWNSITGRPAAAGLDAGGKFSLTIAIGVLVVAYFGLAYQYFVLVDSKRGGTIMGLFLFFAWVVPLLAGAICGAADLGERVTVAVVSLSPVAGISMASMAPNDQSESAQVAALLPAIVFFFLFNNLVTSRRRRVEREVRATFVGKASRDTEAMPDPLAIG